MTKQRLINVLSKVGHLDQDNASQVKNNMFFSKLLNSEVIEDLVEDGRQEVIDMRGKVLLTIFPNLNRIPPVLCGVRLTFLREEILIDV